MSSRINTIVGAAMCLVLMGRGAEGAAKPRVLHAFSGADGADPTCRLIQDSHGVLYGTTRGGDGTVFRLTPPAQGRTAWKLDTLWAFSGSDTASPVGGVVMDGAGNLYGVGANGGRFGYGSVFELTPPAQGKTAWGKAVLWDFGGPGDGQNPGGGLTLGPDGTLFGTTSGGGTGYGTVYSLTPPAGGGTAWTEQLIWNFAGGATGAAPRAALALGAAGVLFGTSGQGGANGNGTIFSLTPPSGGQTGWTGALLYSFPAGDLDNTAAEVAIGAGGALFGTTILGGTHRGGTVFELAPPARGKSAWRYRTIANPPARTELLEAGLAVTASGTLVGAGGGLGNGEVFMVTPRDKRSWVLTTVGLFDGRNGKSPFATPLVGSDGTIYGTTEVGGKGGAGVVYSIAP